jgi:homocitrate synthase NifV
MLSSLEVKSLRLADTVGVLTPARIREMMEELKNHTDMKIGIHAHNDFGMAVANSLEAAKAGAAFIDTTLFGIGERAGNCDMAKFIKAAGHCTIPPDFARHFS